MIRKTQNFTVNSLVKNLKNGKITLNSPIQRPAGQWDIKKKSLLVHSVLNMFIPDIYALQYKDEKGENTYDIIDGKQRLTTLASFMQDEFKLEKLPMVKLENTGETLDISGLLYSELPEDAKEEFKSHTLNFRVLEIEESDDEEEVIDEVFYRLNNGCPVSKEHMTLISAPKKIQEFVQNCVKNNKLFEFANFSANQIKKSDREMTVIQTIALFSGEEFKSFSTKDIENFISETDIKDEVLVAVDSALTKLSELVEEKQKLYTKVNIPMFAELMNDYEAGEFLVAYFDETKVGDKYRNNCSAGSIKIEKVQARRKAITEFYNDYMKDLQEMES